MIKVFNNNPSVLVNTNKLYGIVNLVLSAEGKKARRINFIFTDDEELLKMKKRYFGREELTDTISFNLNEPWEPIEGEVYISVDRVKENAATYQVSVREELARVIIHSVLHLCGYNDQRENEKEKMQEMEEFYLQRADYYHLYRKKGTK